MEDLDVDGTVILKCTVEKYGIKVCTELNWLKAKFAHL
jgi:hypothetical protein